MLLVSVDWWPASENGSFIFMGVTFVCAFGGTLLLISKGDLRGL